MFFDHSGLKLKMVSNFQFETNLRRDIQEIRNLTDEKSFKNKQETLFF